MNKNIFIVTGKIKSGKTTSLFNFAAKTKYVDGILTPVIDNRRYLFHLSGKTLKQLEANDTDVDVYKVGRFKFLIESFDWANKIILESLNEKNEWFIVDEIGPLELNGKGFYVSIEKLIKHPNLSSKLVLVVREQLVENVLDLFNLSNNDVEFLEL